MYVVQPASNQIIIHVYQVHAQRNWLMFEHSAYGLKCHETANRFKHTTCMDRNEDKCKTTSITYSTYFY